MYQNPLICECIIKALIMKREKGIYTHSVEELYTFVQLHSCMLSNM